MSTSSTDARVAPAQSSDDKRRKRLLSYSSKNMIYSLLAVVALAFAWWSITPNPEQSQRRPAQVEEAADFASRQAGWPIWSAVGLGSGWTASTVSFATADGVPDWRQGWVSPTQEYVALQQAVDPADGWSTSALEDKTEQVPLTLDGPAGPQEWVLWSGVDRNDVPVVALVLEPTAEQPATTIVHGTADIPEMTTFVNALEVIEPTE